MRFSNKFKLDHIGHSLYPYLIVKSGHASSLRCRYVQKVCFLVCCSIKEYVGDPSKIDEDSYFYQKSVCFTGTCKWASRDKLLQTIADIGGFPQKGVNKSTQILVVGQQDYRKVGEDCMSSKQEKAMALKDAGQDIEVMSEEQFLSMLGVEL